MRNIVARLERLPYCSWHLNMRLIVCTAWFFDAFDSIAIAYVLPPLIGLWHLKPQEIGSLIGIGSVVAKGTVVEDRVLLAAAARTAPGQVLESGWMYGGSPARQMSRLDALDEDLTTGWDPARQA